MQKYDWRILLGSIVIGVAFGVAYILLDVFYITPKRDAANNTATVQAQTQAAPRELSSSATSLCDRGHPNPMAMQYQGTGIRPHSIYSEYSELPEEWISRSIGETEIIICWDFTEIMVEKCQYGSKKEGVYIERIRHDAVVYLLSLYSGETIAMKEFRGLEPETCPSIYHTTCNEAGHCVSKELTSYPADGNVNTWIEERLGGE